MLRVLTCFAALLLTIASAPAQQPSRLDQIISRGTLRVDMTGDYRPFTFLDKETQKFSGFDVDMAESLGKALGAEHIISWLLTTSSGESRILVAKERANRALRIVKAARA